MTKQIEMGTSGRTVGPLRPTGRVRIGDETFEARSEGSWVDADVDVVVVGQSPFGLVVRLRTEAEVDSNGNSRTSEISPGTTAETTPLNAPPALVERINGVVFGTIIACLLIPIAWLNGEPLSLYALLMPASGVVAGAVFQWCVRGAGDFMGPRANHRPLAYFVAAVVVLGAAIGVIAGLGSGFGFLGLAGALVLGTFLGGAFAWGGTILTIS